MGLRASPKLTPLSQVCNKQPGSFSRVFIFLKELFHFKTSLRVTHVFPFYIPILSICLIRLNIRINGSKMGVESRGRDNLLKTVLILLPLNELNSAVF